MQGILTKHQTNKKLVSGIFKELQITKETMNNLMEKRGKDMNSISWKRK